MKGLVSTIAIRPQTMAHRPNFLIDWPVQGNRMGSIENPLEKSLRRPTMQYLPSLTLLKTGIWLSMMPSVNSYQRLKWNAWSPFFWACVDEPESRHLRAGIAEKLVDHRVLAKGGGGGLHYRHNNSVRNNKKQNSDTYPIRTETTALCLP